MRRPTWKLIMYGCVLHNRRCENHEARAVWTYCGDEFIRLDGQRI